MPEGVEFVLAGVEDAGFRTDLLINFRTLMARGLELRHEEKLHDGSGIDHLSEEFFATADPLIGQAFEIAQQAKARAKPARTEPVAAPVHRVQQSHGLSQRRCGSRLNATNPLGVKPQPSSVTRARTSLGQGRASAPIGWRRLEIEG